MPIYPVKDRTIKMTLAVPGATASNPAATQPAYVRQFIPNSGLLGGLVNGLTPAPPTSISLVGPTKISIKFSAGVAAESGLFTNFLQPWFIKPVMVSIMGTSYIGNSFRAVQVRQRRAGHPPEVPGASQSDLPTQSWRPPAATQRIALQLTGMPAGFSRFLGYIMGFQRRSLRRSRGSTCWTTPSAS